MDAAIGLCTCWMEASCYINLAVAEMHCFCKGFGIMYRVPIEIIYLCAHYRETN
jgi:hypothetical protein